MHIALHRPAFPDIHVELQSTLIKCPFNDVTFFPFNDVTLFPFNDVTLFPQHGWFKLLTAEEGEFYNVPVPSEEEELIGNLKKMRVSSFPNLLICEFVLKFESEFGFH